MDAFFASVEVARRPELRGRPLVVGGSGRSVVLAATYPAREFGVHSAMPMAQARRLCPQLVVVPPDHAAYLDASRLVMQILGEVTALVEQVSIDEAFLDVSGARRRLGPATRVAGQVRERVARELGVTCSVGIGATKHVAKLASGLAKPDGVLLVPRGATLELLHSLPVQALWGVGDRTRAALSRWGIETVAQLAHEDPAVLRRAVGSVQGAHLRDLAWGRDPRPVVPERAEKSIGAQTTFEVDTDDLTWIERRLLWLADRTARQLRSRGLVARTVTLTVRTADWHTLTRSRSLGAPSDVAHELYLTARDLLGLVDLGGQAVRLVGIRADALGSVEDRQPTLEESVAGGSARRRAEQAMDAVRHRFGPASVGPAATLAGPIERPTTAHASGDLS